MVADRDEIIFVNGENGCCVGYHDILLVKKNAPNFRGVSVFSVYESVAHLTTTNVP
jgi:hypothetical protein